jgi:hypothetical protein
MNEHTSLELSRRLHEKGFRAEHDKVWVHHWSKDSMQWSLCDIDEDDKVNEQIPAYTFTELWGVFPLKIYTDDTPFYLIIDRAVRKLPVMSVGYKDINYEHYGSDVFNHESPTEALGLLVEWLIDEGHIEVSQDQKEGA